MRFTMHQQRVSHSHDHDYNTMSQDRLKSCFRREITSSNLPQVPAHVGLSQVLANKTLARPQSSFVKNRPVTQHQTSRPQVRAKSAHPRLLQAHKYVHTNASTTQLQVGDKVQRILRWVFGQGNSLEKSFQIPPLTVAWETYLWNRKGMKRKGWSKMVLM